MAEKSLVRFSGQRVKRWVHDAVSVMSRVLGMKIHILTPEEVPRALAYAKALIVNEEVREVRSRSRMR